MKIFVLTLFTIDPKINTMLDVFTEEEEGKKYFESTIKTLLNKHGYSNAVTERFEGENVETFICYSTLGEHDKQFVDVKLELNTYELGDAMSITYVPDCDSCRYKMKYFEHLKLLPILRQPIPQLPSKLYFYGKVKTQLNKTDDSTYSQNETYISEAECLTFIDLINELERIERDGAYQHIRYTAKKPTPIITEA